jgi:CDP-diacylglycerol--glycerol-3-phosphate 3-phosphatidyltransferase
MKQQAWLNLPNIITISRIAAIPLLMSFMYISGPFWSRITAVIFLLASITDFIDGWLARRWDKVTTLGRYLDPLSDKLLITAMLIMLVTLERIPAWMAVVIISREIWVTGLRALAAEHGLNVPSDIWGKSKTFLQMLVLTMLIYHYPLCGIDLHSVGWWLMWMVMTLTLWSGIRYTWSFRKILISS